VKKFLVFAAGVVSVFIAEAVLKNVTFHSGTCEENMASRRMWEEDSSDKPQGGKA